MLTQGAAEAQQFLSTYGATYEGNSPQLVEELSAVVLLACGVPPALAAGTAYRDAWRGFLAAGAQPVADQLAAAVTAQLGVPCAIEARARHNTPADLVSRSRAVGSLQAAGVDTDRALELAGLAWSAASPPSAHRGIAATRACL